MMRATGAILSAVLVTHLAAFHAGGAWAETAPGGARIDFERLVSARVAVEQVYHEHRIGATEPFQESRARLAAEKRVRRMLERSAILDARVGHAITGERLRREVQRIERTTRLPEVLRQIRSVLADPVLFEELVARDSLTHRWLGPGRDDDLVPELWADVSEWVSRRGSGEGSPQASTAVESGSCGDPDRWISGAFGTVPENRDGHTLVWTGTEVIVFGGGVNADDRAFRYDPVVDLWSELSRENAPGARGLHGAVWTGTEMLVWGGRVNPATLLATGSRYDPVADSWTPITAVDAPAARENHTMVWTGTEAIVWGGQGQGGFLGDGAAYDPASDSWRALTSTGAPSARELHTAVWTGESMIIWGGRSTVNQFFRSGGIYDPAADSWIPTFPSGAPSPRAGHAAVWTGEEMVVWAGYDDDPLADGARFDPDLNRWSPMTTSGAPSAREGGSAAWTGEAMFYWGGAPGGFGTELDDGGLYDPVADVWTPLSTVGAPAPRGYARSILTSQGVMVWGGIGASPDMDRGGLYDPATDSWSPTAYPVDAPPGRQLATAIWTGTEFLVFGGGTLETDPTPGRFDAVIGAWVPMSTENAPEGRRRHLAAWTGSAMLIWGGGRFPNIVFSDGAAYDPMLDIWTPIPAAPIAGRDEAAGVWTGSELIVWGGFGGGGISDLFADGARYDPFEETWASMDMTGAPSPRRLHTATWTGEEMIVLGGLGGSGTVPLDSAARYDPARDRWVAMTSAPNTRSEHSATWTGWDLLVIGGRGLGGNLRYDASNDVWSPLPTGNELVDRIEGTAVWTGREATYWGGSDPARNNYFREGASYDVPLGSWSPTSLNGTPPTARSRHQSAFTGDEIWIWGGIWKSFAGSASTQRLGHGARWILDSDGDGEADACDLDDDGDTVPDGADCAAKDPGVASEPVDVSNLRFATRSTLEWSAQDPDTRFDLVYGTLNSIRTVGTGAAKCLEAGIVGSGYTDSMADPIPGIGRYFLVRTRNVCGRTGLGQATSGPRPELVEPCR